MNNSNCFFFCHVRHQDNPEINKIKIQFSTSNQVFFNLKYLSKFDYTLKIKLKTYSMM